MFWHKFAFSNARFISDSNSQCLRDGPTFTVNRSIHSDHSAAALHHETRCAHTYLIKTFINRTMPNRDFDFILVNRAALTHKQAHKRSLHFTQTRGSVSHTCKIVSHTWYCGTFIYYTDLLFSNPCALLLYSPHINHTFFGVHCSQTNSKPWAL